MPSDERATRSSRLLAPFDTPGLTSGQERVLTVALVLVLALFAGGWGYVVVETAAEREVLGVARELATSPLASTQPPPVERVLDRLMTAVRSDAWAGRSGAVRALILEDADSARLARSLGLDSLPAGARVELDPTGEEPAPRGKAGAEARPGTERPGVFSVLLRLRNSVRRVADVTVLNPVPTNLVTEGRLGDYLIGEWPTRRERPARLRTEAYDPPTGLIAVTPRNRDTPVSEHLTLGDFLTKGQRDVWPKYVAITPELLDKVELTIQELERAGHPVENVGVISGFRTPYYNAHGGSTGGRGSVSRHMYGDALDFYIDNDRDARMDDLTGDGRVTIADSRVIARAANQVEKNYPEYVGGIGVYGPRPGAHAGFVHVDARGYRARW